MSFYFVLSLSLTMSFVDHWQLHYSSHFSSSFTLFFAIQSHNWLYSHALSIYDSEHLSVISWCLCFIILPCITVLFLHFSLLRSSTSWHSYYALFRSFKKSRIITLMCVWAKNIKSVKVEAAVQLQWIIHTHTRTYACACFMLEHYHLNVTLLTQYRARKKKVKKCFWLLCTS